MSDVQKLIWTSRTTSHVRVARMIGRCLPVRDSHRDSCVRFNALFAPRQRMACSCSSASAPRLASPTRPGLTTITACGPPNLLSECPTTA